MRRYQKFDATSTDYPGMFERNYWNPEVDIIRTDLHSYSLATVWARTLKNMGMFEEFLGQIRFLDLGIKAWNHQYSLMIENIMAGEVPHMKNLREFRIVKVRKGRAGAPASVRDWESNDTSNGWGCLSLVSMGFNELMEGGRLDTRPVISVCLKSSMWTRRVGTSTYNDWAMDLQGNWANLLEGPRKDKQSMWRT